MSTDKAGLTLQETAARLHVSTSTVRRLQAAGDLHGAKVEGRWQFDEAEVQRYWDSLALTLRQVDVRRARERQSEEYRRAKQAQREREREEVKRLKSADAKRGRTR